MKTPGARLPRPELLPILTPPYTPATANIFQFHANPRYNGIPVITNHFNPNLGVRYNGVRLYLRMVRSG